MGLWEIFSLGERNVESTSFGDLESEGFVGCVLESSSLPDELLRISNRSKPGGVKVTARSEIVFPQWRPSCFLFEFKVRSARLVSLQQERQGLLNKV